MARRLPGNQALLRLERKTVAVKTRVAVDALGDPLEREADAVAERVMNQKAVEAVAPSGMQGSSRSSAYYGPSDDTRTLPNTVRSGMEDQLGSDLRSVRIHTGLAAAAATRSLDARAYTMGNDIVFGAGEYAPETLAGLGLLAHELTHVVQQRSLGPAIQRKPVSSEPPLNHTKDSAPAAGTAEPATGDATTVHLGPFEITTHRALLGAIRLLINDLQSDLVDTEDHSRVRAAAANWIASKGELQPQLERHGSEPLTPTIAGLARGWFKEALEIRRELAAEKTASKDRAVRRDLKAARDRARSAARQLEELKSEADQRLRMAYRTEKPGLIARWAEELDTSLSLAKYMLGLAEELTKTLTSEDMGALVERDFAAKLATGLGYATNGWALLDLASTTLNSEKKATELEQGMRELSDAVAVFESLTTLGPVAPHVGLFAERYLAPMLKRIGKQTSIVVDRLHDLNVVLDERGGPVNEGVEPGPGMMLDFMKAVMIAEVVEDVPAFDPEVAKYFVSHRESLEAGIGTQVPTKGFWRWRTFDGSQGRKWVFNNRERIRALLYGSMRLGR